MKFILAFFLAALILFSLEARADRYLKIKVKRATSLVRLLKYHKRSKYYGKGIKRSWYNNVLKYNKKLKNPRKIQVGQIIYLPIAKKTKSKKKSNFKKKSYTYIALPIVYSSLVQKVAKLEVTTDITSMIGIHGQWQQNLSSLWQLKSSFQYGKQAVAMEDARGEVASDPYNYLSLLGQRTLWSPRLSIDIGAERETLAFFDMKNFVTNTHIEPASLSTMLFKLGTSYRPDWTNGGEISLFYAHALSASTSTGIEEITGSKLGLKFDYIFSKSWLMGINFVKYSYATTKEVRYGQMSYTMKIGYIFF